MSDAPTTAATKSVPNLTGVPETMLWPLYNRAMESKRADAVLRDPESVRIFDALDYDFARSFGDPDPAQALRALESDALVKAFLAKHPGATVVSLGEGLETQALRCDDGKVRWLSVDLPESIAIRERFIKPDERRTHIAKSALDRAWMDAVPPGQPVFVIAQGLFMYFTADDVRALVRDMGERFRGGELFFDAIPHWFSRMTMKGAKRTPHYTLPPMPWGVNIDEIDGFLRTASPHVAEVRIIPYRLPRTWLRWVMAVAGALPRIKHARPTMAWARFAGMNTAS